MEFVEGETLEKLIKRSGRLEIKLALEIATQVAAGLAAVHEQSLVHRDIKPTNIMVSLKEEASVTAKIIDLGLAKALDEPASQAGISSPGVFVGTPEFASPEQFAGIGVDIRSDLYSLGVTLWVMVAGETPFRGTPGEVMYQHQHAPLPVEQLEGVPQPIDGVNDTLRKNYLEEVKRQATAYAQDYYGIKDPLEAYKRITSDPNAGTFIGEIGSSGWTRWVSRQIDQTPGFYAFFNRAASPLAQIIKSHLCYASLEGNCRKEEAVKHVNSSATIERQQKEVLAKFEGMARASQSRPGVRYALRRFPATTDRIAHGHCRWC
jgi:serine/threonine protein kinase